MIRFFVSDILAGVIIFASHSGLQGTDEAWKILFIRLNDLTLVYLMTKRFG